MNSYFYDLHIHSCLSPCADDDMTPNNIANMGNLLGLNLMALTDHNTCKNLPPFFAACKRNGIVPVGGMELTTAEEIHLLCLFETLEAALEFGKEIQSHLPPIKNRADIFGNQLITDDEDNVIGEEEKLLLSATDLDLDSAVKLVRSYGGAAYPAHVDRESNGIIAILGDIPPEPGFTACEFNDGANTLPYQERYKSLRELTTLSCSDAHHLWDISEAENSLTLDDEPYSGAKVRSSLIRMLKGCDER